MKRIFQTGFTLVELLIVISIISLLAGIVIANVAPARDEAQNSRKSTDIGQYTINLRLLKEKNGAYPSPDGTSTWACLGEYDGGNCWRNGNSVSEGTNPNDALSDLMNSLPTTDTPLVGEGGDEYVGYRYRCLDGCNEYRIEWYMYGPSADCDPGDRDGSHDGDNTLCEFES